MTPFLQQIASLFYREYGTKIARLAFVFPNRRAGLFFRKYLSELSDKPLFSPTILTINDLFMQMSGLQLADRISMLFSLYTDYVEKSNSEETFDAFLYWGEMLLNDFDDVDKYMADARMLFTNVTDLRSIENDFSFLSATQIEAIRTFWSAFSPESSSANQKEFLAVWEVLYGLYTSLRKRLFAQGKGYEGMIFRDVADRLKDGEEFDLPYEKIVFVGLNALSVVEHELLKQLQKRELTDFYWDYSSPFVNDPNNRASFFTANNQKQYPSCFSLPQEEQAVPEIEVVGVPSGVGQAKHVYKQIDEWIASGELTKENAIRTAIVLPDEHMLIPVLNSIPEAVRNINVTMGYPLSSTPIASFIDFILALQKNVRHVNREPVFYYRDVLPVLNHRYVVATDPVLIPQKVKAIIEHNRISVPAQELTITPLLEVIFKPVESVDDFMDYLINVLQKLNNILNVEDEPDEESEEDSGRFTMNEIEQEFVFHYFTTINRIKAMISDCGIDMTIDTCFRLIRRATETITIPFEGEPLSGLQIMGVLETRALDFDRIVILSMNEGIFPSVKAAGSFIPYNLRRGFGLPTYEHQDSVWAYHFYRLLYRTSKISLIYDTRRGDLMSGEVSRYVHQLRYHYEAPLHDKLVIYNVSSSKLSPVEVKKDAAIMEKLSRYYAGGEKAISASAVNTYLDCPLKFYFSVVEEVQEEEEVSETIENSVFGSILHKVMEILYKPLCGKVVMADVLKAIKKDEKTMTETIRKAFASEFFKSKKEIELAGQHYLIGEMIRKYALKVIDIDIRMTPFTYLSSEERMHDTIRLSNDISVALKGFIDRVDEVNGVIRIIDYKSGGGTTMFPSVESLFDKENDDRAKAVMQVFMYCWLYGRSEKSDKTKNMSLGIYYMRTLFSSDFDPSVYKKTGRDKPLKVDCFGDYSLAFESELRKCLEEIFDPSVAFSQTSTRKACTYCQFKNLCG